MKPSELEPVIPDPPIAPTSIHGLGEFTGGGNSIGAGPSWAAAQAGEVVALLEPTEQARHDYSVASERLALSVMAQTDEAIVACDEHAQVIRANQAALRFCDRSPLLRPFADAYPLRTHASEPISLARVLDGGTLRNVDVTLDWEGQRFELILSAGPLLSDQQTLGCVVTLTDVTARRRAESALVASEKRYRRLFETAKDGILILDADTGAVVDVNPFLVDLLGYSRQTFLGKRVWELGYFSDIVANEANFDELKQKGYVRYEDLPLETSDGRQIDVEFVSNVYLVDEQKVIQCNVRDITARRRTETALAASELSYRRLFETAKDGILILDADTGAVVDVNPFLVDLLGYTRHTFLGKQVWELGLFKDIVANQANFEELKQKGYVRYDDLPLEASDGRQVEVEFVSNLYAVDRQQVIQCNIRDVTARKVAERAERARTDLLQ